MKLLGAMKKLKYIFNNFSKACSTKRLIWHITVNCHPPFWEWTLQSTIKT